MSVLSADGVTILNPLTQLTLRSSGDSTGIVAVTADSVAGFGGFREILFELSVTAVSITGGGTITLTAWVQRKTPSGQWDDLLALKTAALATAALPLYHVADYPGTVAAGPTPALVQDSGGSPPFATRGSWVSDDLRVKSKVDVASGTASDLAVTWSLIARGRA